MLPDIEKYRPYMEGFDLTDAQKADLAQSVWAMMAQFVDIAFGAAPEQTLLGINDTRATQDERDQVESSHAIKTEFEDAAQEAAEERNR